jgi:hypothetical protein
MTALSIQPTYPIFTETDGQPLEDGYIWLGVANLDPQGNPINVYWDAALTQLAGQPIRTQGGYPVNSGTPARLYVNSDYSIRVMNKNGSTVYSAPAATERYGNVITLTGMGIPNPRDFGAVGDGVTNDTAAFNACRAATGGKYLITPGSYVLDLVPNIWEDTFVAPYGNTELITDATYDISGSFGSGWKNSTPSTQRYLYWTHARTGETIAIWSDGELTSDSNRFFLPFDVRRDSHFFIAAPGTNGGACDLLFRRSEANADPRGNRFAINFEESLDRYSVTFATSASGLPAFDAAMQIIAGPSPSLVFPAIALDMKQGYIIQTRALGALRIQNYPTSATTQAIRDTTTGNVLQNINRSRQALAGVAFDTLLDTPQGVTQPRMWGGVFSDVGSERDGDLPVTKNLWSTTGAVNGNQVIGTLMVSIATSNGTVGYRETRFVFNGTTVTLTDLVNTLPVQVTATVAVSGTDLQFQASYAGGIGVGCTVSAMINWCGAGR